MGKPLNRLSKRTGRSKSFYAWKAIEKFLGELGLAVREVQKKHRPPSSLQEQLESVMSAVHVAWP